jgi:hypothetical protein
MSRHRFRHCLIATLLVAAALTLQTQAFAEDRMVLGPRQYEADHGGGAVLCVWAIELSIQAQTKACGLTRRPVDDAFDEAIAAMDEFIMANSSLHPTRAMLEDFKRRATESELRMLRQRGLEQACANPDLEHFRSMRPDEVRASTKALLAVPREPVMNPCL